MNGLSKGGVSSGRTGFLAWMEGMDGDFGLGWGIFYTDGQDGEDFGLGGWGVGGLKRNAVLSVSGVGAGLGAVCYNFAVTSKLEVSM